MLQKHKMKKRGVILLEHTIFIALNLIFLTILILFLFLKTGDVGVLEERYAKQIALAIDSAKPIMNIKLNMEDAMKKSDKYLGKDNFDKIVRIENNIVTVQLRDKGGYSYSFFNDVSVGVYPNRDINNDYTGEYILTINEK